MKHIQTFESFIVKNDYHITEGQLDNYKYSKQFGGITIYTNAEQEYVGNMYSPFEGKGSFKADVSKGSLVNIAIESKELESFNFKWVLDDWNTISKKLKEKKYQHLNYIKLVNILKHMS